MSENITADRANFRMIYEQEAKRQKANDQLPLGIKTEKEKILDSLVTATVEQIEHKEEQEIKVADMHEVKKMIEGLKQGL